MIANENKSETYIPFHKIIFCGNELINCKNLIVIGSEVPLIIGNGSKPMIWLKAIVNQPDNKFITIVDSSIPLNPKVKVIGDTNNNNIKVLVEDVTVIQVRKDSSDSAEISILDLRPIGINLYGDESCLYAGSIKISKNKFNNLNAAIEFKK